MQQSASLLGLAPRLVRTYARYRWKLVGLAGISIFSAVMEATALASLIPLISAMVAPEKVFHGEVGFLNLSVTLSVEQLLVMCIGAIAGRAISQVAVAYFSSRLTNSYEATRRRMLFERFLDASWEVQSREEGGRLQNFLTENVAQGKKVLHAMAQGIVSITNFLILLVAALYVNWMGAACILAVAGALFLLTRPISRFARWHAFRKAALNVEFAGEVNQAVAMAKEIRVFNVADHFQRFTADLVERVRRSRVVSDLLTAIIPVVYQNTAGLIVVVGLAAAYYGGFASLESLAAVALLLIRALTYSQASQSLYHQITEGVAYLDQMEEVETAYQDSKVPSRGRTLQEINHLAFEHVNFSYFPPIPTLFDITFDVGRGEAIGIVGPSGSGKSTLIQLLLRLREPRSGRILVNGQSADEFSPASWFQRISFVPQEPNLLRASIAENIRFHRPDITSAAIRRAAQMAGIHDEIEGMPGGYDTPAGERGAELSGGQRQRICIARALAGHPDVIIFDEPTSSLDVHSESRIHTALSKLKNEVTLFIIAHRLSTLSICDKVMVLRQGRLQAFAAPAVLAETDDYYSESLRLSRLT